MRRIGIFLTMFCILAILATACTSNQKRSLPDLNTKSAAETPYSPGTMLEPGTYRISTDIPPGLYKSVPENPWSLTPCTWERISQTDGTITSSAIGQHYIILKEGDDSFQTTCAFFLMDNMPHPLTDFPNELLPGTYLVGIEMEPGFYIGKSGEDQSESCTVTRLRNLHLDSESIIMTETKTGGSYQIEVQKNDYAFTTTCSLTRSRH